MDDFMVAIKPGNALPIPGALILVSSALGESTAFSVKVKKITNLRWNKAGAIVVEFLGVKMK